MGSAMLLIIGYRNINLGVHVCVHFVHIFRSFRGAGCGHCAVDGVYVQMYTDAGVVDAL